MAPPNRLDNNTDHDDDGMSSIGEASNQTQQMSVALKEMQGEMINMKLAYSELHDQNNKLRGEIVRLKSIVASYENSSAKDDESNAVTRKAKSARLKLEGAASGSRTSSSGTIKNADIKDKTDIIGQTAVTNFNKKQKTKILQVVGSSMATIKDNIKIKAGCSSFTVKQNNKNAPIKITISNEEEIAPIKQALSSAKLSFHEYKFDSEKKQGFIIRGLVGASENDVEDIKNELVAAGLPEQIQVSIFKTGFMRENPKLNHNSLVRLILPPNTDTSVLSKIKYIDHIVVKFEPLHTSNVLQCKNCQMFGHSSTGCQHSHRCVKCGQDHLKEQCKRTTDRSVKLLCCNCGGEHTANNIKECSYAQKFTSSGRPYNNNRSSNSNTIVRSAGNNNSQQTVNIPSRNFNGTQPKSNNANINTTFTALNYKQHSSGSSLRTAQPSQNQMHKSNNSSNSNVSSTYAGVVAGSVSTEGCTCSDNTVIMQKLDQLINIVLKHETILSKLPING